MKTRVWMVAVLLSGAAPASAQSVQQQAAKDAAAMAATVRAEWPRGVMPGGAKPGAWTYELGTLLDGMAAHWQVTHDPDDLSYIVQTVGRWVQPDGSILAAEGQTFDRSLHTLDNLEPGRAVLFCYDVTKAPRYKKAADMVYAQFATQPRTAEGGFWHKQVYPQQMWLDGAYMGEPFRAAYAWTFSDHAAFDDIAKQLMLMDQHARDPQTGLLRHGWDSAKAQPWADKTTGQSPEAWARAMGWYAMALVDTIPLFPASHPAKPELMRVLNEIAGPIAKYQDAETGLWWDVMDKGGREGNFREASASAMFVYAFAKGARLGYLPPQYAEAAAKGWRGLEKTFVTHESNGHLTLHGTVKVSGLGGTPYRAGDYNYYVHEAVVDNDAKGVGAFLLAASEIEQMEEPATRPARSTAPARAGRRRGSGTASTNP